jgi:hypothetical protein
MINKKSPKKIGTFLLKLIPYVIAIASAITAITPNQTDDEVLTAIKQIANVLSLSFAHNVKNDLKDASECQEDN